MTMVISKIENQARALAEKAKPGILNHNGKLYTLVFNSNEWVYDVYEDGFFLLNSTQRKLHKRKSGSKII